MYIFWCDLQHDCTLSVFEKVHVLVEVQTEWLHRFLRRSLLILQVLSIGGF